MVCTLASSVTSSGSSIVPMKKREHERLEREAQEREGVGRQDRRHAPGRPVISTRHHEAAGHAPSRGLPWSQAAVPHRRPPNATIAPTSHRTRPAPSSSHGRHQGAAGSRSPRAGWRPPRRRPAIHHQRGVAATGRRRRPTRGPASTATATVPPTTAATAAARASGARSRMPPPAALSCTHASRQRRRAAVRATTETAPPVEPGAVLPVDVHRVQRPARREVVERRRQRLDQGEQRSGASTSDRQHAPAACTGRPGPSGWRADDCPMVAPASGAGSRHRRGHRVQAGSARGSSRRQLA